jgi:hypothetical protein
MAPSLAHAKIMRITFFLSVIAIINCGASSAKVREVVHLGASRQQLMNRPVAIAKLGLEG